MADWSNPQSATIGACDGEMRPRSPRDVRAGPANGAESVGVEGGVSHHPSQGRQIQ